ncbi:nickel-responsive transcriptional regulator NikR [Candidatus Latescibacterota bacterium]
MADNKIIRFGVSIGESLLEKFDVLIDEKGYTNRSEAIRDLIRDKLVVSDWEDDTDRDNAIGTITIVYDHHTREIGDKLTDIAHNFHDLVISNMHVHLTHSSCLEVMVVKGASKHIRYFADKVISIRGVKHGKLVITGLVEGATEE